MKSGMILILLAGLLASVAATADAPPPPTYHSPCQPAWLDDKTVVVSDSTFARAYTMDAVTGKVTHEVTLYGEPTGLSAVGGVFYVAETGAGTVAEIGADGVLKRRFKVGPRPAGLAVAEKSKRLVVAESGLGYVTVVDLGTGAMLGNIRLIGLPYAVAVTPDEKLAVTVSRLPVGDARREDHAAVLAVLDLETLAKVAEAKLLPGTGAVTGLTVSPDGKWLYIVHALGRFTLPPTQLERGWVNTNALSLFSLTERKLHATVLLDELSSGAADPWGIALTSDGQTAWISLAGTHELLRVDLKTLHSLLSKNTPEQRASLSYDLSAMHVSKTLTRIKMPGAGPRGVAVSPDGATVAAALYFAGQVSLVDAKTLTVRSVSLGTQPAETEARKGERFFYDASLTHQSWLSCATCHPDTRADGFNWDLLNDGIGNPKNVKSLVWSDRTPPMMSLGVREDLPHAVRAGFKFIRFREPAPGEAEAVTAYLQTLKPAPSPYLVNGKLSENGARGEQLFRKIGCADCHPAPLFTDLNQYNVGTSHESDLDAKKFDTPTLVEMWRTAPYLHDGSAATMEEVLKKHNPNDQHGKTTYLSEEEIAALVEYLLSL